MTKLSKVQLETIEIAKNNGGFLERWQGGFWTYPHAEVKHINCEHGKDVNVPVWYCGISTVNSLINKNILEVVESNQFGPTKVKFV